VSGRRRINPHEHVCGEWNIISLNRYRPVSGYTGRQEGKKKRKRASKAVRKDSD
jgi:hypothetical protein